MSTYGTGNAKQWLQPWHWYSMVCECYSNCHFSTIVCQNIHNNCLNESQKTKYISTHYCNKTLNPQNPEEHSFCLSAPSHYLNSCWNIVNWTLRKKLQWNLDRKSNIFIEENAFQNVVWEMLAIFLGLNVLSMTWKQQLSRSIMCIANKYENENSSACFQRINRNFFN